VQKDEYKVASCSYKNVVLRPNSVPNLNSRLKQPSLSVTWRYVFWSIAFSNCTFLELGDKEAQRERCCFLSIHFYQHRILLPLISPLVPDYLPFIVHLILDLCANFEIRFCLLRSNAIELKDVLHLRKLSIIRKLSVSLTMGDPRSRCRSNRVASEARGRSRLSKVIRRDSRRSLPSSHMHEGCLLPRRRKSYPAGKLHFPVLPEA